MKNKLRLFIIVAILAICLGTVACISTISSKSDKLIPVAKAQNGDEEGYEVKSYITEEIKNNAVVCKSELCLLEEFTPSKLKKDADTIALVSIISLDGSDPEGTLVGSTNGKLLVNNVLLGNLEEGQVVNYSKPGGIMKMSEWEKSQPEAANKKREYLRKQSGIDLDLNNTYINVLVGGDIEIEAGKTYLAYLKYNGVDYEIIGLGNGLREVNVEQSLYRVVNTKYDTASLKIKNNETGKFESLQEYIDTYINNI